MRSARFVLPGALLLTAGLLQCELSVLGTSGADSAGSRDAAVVDSSVHDAYVLPGDSSAPEAGPAADGGGNDTGTADSGSSGDAGSADTGTPDSGPGGDAGSLCPTLIPTPFVNGSVQFAGNATYVTPYLQLTRDDSAQAGAVSWTNKFTAANGFDIDIEFELQKTNAGDVRANGFAFGFMSSLPARAPVGNSGSTGFGLCGGNFPATRTIGLMTKVPGLSQEWVALLSGSVDNNGKCSSTHPTLSYSNTHGGALTTARDDGKHHKLSIRQRGVTPIETYLDNLPLPPQDQDYFSAAELTDVYFFMSASTDASIYHNAHRIWSVALHTCP